MTMWALPNAALPAPRWRLADWAWAATVVVACAAVYAPVSGHGFLIWDDPGYVTANARVQQGPTAANLAWALTAYQMGNWHPLTMISHMVDVGLFGAWAGGHHLVSVALHAAAALLFQCFLRQCGAQAMAAGIAAVAFAVHPLHVESVAWISARKDVLSAVFWMLALVLYVGYARRPSPLRYVGVTVAFGLALMAKPVAVTLPLLLLVLDRWPLRRRDPAIAGASVAARLAVEKLPWLALAGVTAVVTVVAQAAVGSVSDLAVVPLAQRPPLAATAYAAFLADAVLPSGLAYLYELRLPVDPLAIAASGLALLAVSAGVVVARREAPWLGVGWLWYLIVLLPMIGLVHVGFHARADRYMYLPLAGLLVAAAFGLDRVHRGRRLVLVVALLWLVALAFLAQRYVRTWATTESVYARAVEVEPRHCLARIGLAHADIEAGRHEPARRRIVEVLADCRQAAAQERASLLAARQLQSLGDPAGAEREYRAVLARWPKSGPARVHLGSLLVASRRYDEAADVLLAADAALDDDRQWRRLVADALLRGDRHRRAAVDLFRRWAGEAPDDAPHWFYLGVALDRVGDDAGATDAYRRSLAIDPASATARLRLAGSLARMSRYSEARAEVTRVLSADSGQQSARELLAAIDAAVRANPGVATR